MAEELLYDLPQRFMAQARCGISGSGLGPAVGLTVVSLPADASAGYRVIPGPTSWLVDSAECGGG
ncbi:MAG: hypothetical protein GY854_29400 [Deltaproteobacteria bacterium]|nr:hypothetical protein [Deltaproteobacteria bacterium]